LLENKRKQSWHRIFLFFWGFDIQYKSRRIITVAGKKPAAEKLYLSTIHQMYILVYSCICLQNRKAICLETSLSFLFFPPLHQKEKSLGWTRMVHFVVITREHKTKPGWFPNVRACPNAPKNVFTFC